MWRRPGTTRSVAVADTDSVPFDAVAVMDAGPSLRPATNVVSLPEGVDSVPTVDGSSAQLAVTGNAFPYESAPVDVRRCTPRAGTSAVAGTTAKVAIGPGSTVRIWVPLVAPSAAAVSVWLPAFVSW